MPSSMVQLKNGAHTLRIYCNNFNALPLFVYKYQIICLLCRLFIYWGVNSILLVSPAPAVFLSLVSWS